MIAREAVTPHFVGAAVLAVLGALVVRGLWRRVAWMRSLIVGLTVVGLAGSIILVMLGQGVPYPRTFAVQAVRQGIAAVLLIRPRSRARFASP